MLSAKFINFERLSRLTGDNLGAFFAVIDFDGNLLDFDSGKAPLLGLDQRSLNGFQSVRHTLLPSLRADELPICAGPNRELLFPRAEYYPEVQRHVVWEAELDADSRTALLFGSSVHNRQFATVEYDQLTERLRRHNRLLSNLPGMVYRCRIDRSWTMEFVSEGVTALCGYPKESFLSGDLSWGEEIIEARDRQSVWEGVINAVKKREAFTLYYGIITRDGHRKTVWERGVGIYNQAGEAVALEGFITDMTSQIETQNALREAKERAEASNRAKDEFLAVISHEMRTPLNPILGFSTMLLEEYPHGETGEALQIIQRSANKLLRQIEDILEFIGIDKHKTKCEPRPTRLWDYVNQFKRDMEPLCNGNAFELVYGCS